MSINEILSRFEPRPENLLSILQAVQESHPTHHLTPEDLKAVARYLNLSYSRVYGVASYCSMFNLEPRGRHIIRVCDSPACQLMGATTVLDELKNILQINENETTPDGEFTLETTSCLGVCGIAPAMVIDEEVYGNLTPEKVREIIEEYRRRESK